MKKHITIEQLNELSDKGKNRLREWWKPQWGDLCTGYSSSESSKFSIVDDEHDNIGIVIHPRDLDNQLPLLSLGQMIEFLGGDPYRCIHMFFNDIDCERIEPDVLCDELWRNVVGELEKEDI